MSIFFSMELLSTVFRIVSLFHGLQKQKQNQPHKVIVLLSWKWISQVCSLKSFCKNTVSLEHFPPKDNFIINTTTLFVWWRISWAVALCIFILRWKEYGSPLAASVKAPVNILFPVIFTSNNVVPVTSPSKCALSKLITTSEFVTVIIVEPFQREWQTSSSLNTCLCIS